MGRMSGLETGRVTGEACPHTRDAGEKRRVYALRHPFRIKNRAIAGLR
jgi:hypothetical protein